MIGARAGEAGRADSAAVAAALLLAAAALAPVLLLRGRPAMEKARTEVPATTGRPAATGGSEERERFGATLARAEALRPVLATSAFRPEPSRILRPSPEAPEEGAVRVADLDGRVEKGRLVLRWRPVPGSRGTLVRVEGLGGEEALEREVPAGEDGLRVAVTGAEGTILVRATPVGGPRTAAEARVSIPFRVPCEVLRAEKADPDADLALLVLRRDFDGEPVEAAFAVHGNDEVGGLAAVGAGRTVVEFRTGYVVEEVRQRPPSGPLVPRFLADGRVLRDGGGAPTLEARGGGSAPAPIEVVLRGVGEDRRIVETR